VTVDPGRAVVLDGDLVAAVGEVDAHGAVALRCDLGVQFLAVDHELDEALDALGQDIVLAGAVLAGDLQVEPHRDPSPSSSRRRGRDCRW
jgi:hypothetical protein